MIAVDLQEKLSFKKNYRKIALLSSLGLLLPSSIAVGLFLGYGLDKLFGTQPWLLFILTLLGIASGLYSLIRGVSKLSNDKESDPDI